MNKWAFYLSFGSSKGFTLVESILASGMLALVGLGTFAGMKYFSNQLCHNTESQAKDLVIKSVLEEMLPNIGRYAVTYDRRALENIQNSAYKDVSILMVDALPLAWDVGILPVPVEQCAGCKGRIGFIIQPEGDASIAQNRGLYQVTFRVTHEDLFGKNADGTKKFEDYSVVVRDK